MTVPGELVVEVIGVTRKNLPLVGGVLGHTCLYREREGGGGSKT